jgi:hypothetical protein
MAMSGAREKRQIKRKDAKGRRAEGRMEGGEGGGGEMEMLRKEEVAEGPANHAKGRDSGGKGGWGRGEFRERAPSHRSGGGRAGGTTITRKRSGPGPANGGVG